MKRKKAYLNLVFGTFIISFAPIFARLVQSDGSDFSAMDPSAAAFYRMVLGGIFLLLVLKIQGKSLFGTNKKVLMYLCCGATFFALDMAVWYRSILIVGPGLATLLASFQVFVLTFAGFLFFNEKPLFIQWLSIPIALFGLALIVGIDLEAINPEYTMGVGLGLIAAICYAIYIIALRGANKYELDNSADGNDPVRIVTIVTLLTAVILFFITWGLGESFLVQRPINWLWLILVGVLCQAIAWVLISSSLPFVRAAHVGLIILLQPIFAFIWDILIFDRGISRIEILGALITIVAIYLGSKSKTPVNQ